MYCRYCGRKLKEGERCRCQYQKRSRQQDPYARQNTYQQPQSKRSAKEAAKAAKRRRRKRRFRKFVLTLILLALLIVLGLLGFRWLEDHKETVLSWLPFTQESTQGEILKPTGTIAQNVGETTAWTDAPVAEDDHAAEIARIKTQYEEGRIDYGGVKKNLGRMDTTMMLESDLASYQNLAAQAEQDLRDTLSGYITNGYYSEAYALLNRMNQTVPGDAVVAELISLYGAQIGM